MSARECPLFVWRGNPQFRVQTGTQRPPPIGNAWFLAASIRQTVSFSWANFSRHLVGEVVGLRPIFLQIVEFPLVLVGRPFA